MKSLHLMSFPTIFFLFMISSCSTISDKARTDLKQMNVAYDNNTFVDKAGKGDVEAVKRFLDTGMGRSSSNFFLQTVRTSMAGTGSPAEPL